jgi:hypothetical protein
MEAGKAVSMLGHGLYISPFFVLSRFPVRWPLGM